jgi:hypothetical protein
MAVKIYGSNRIDLDGNNETFSIRATTDDELNFYKGASTKLMGIDASGFESKPNVPAFFVYVLGDETYGNSWQKIKLANLSDSTGVTHGSSYINYDTHRFTAPITGRYAFSAAATFAAGTNTDGTITIAKNGGLDGGRSSSWPESSYSALGGVGASYVLLLNTGDSAEIQIYFSSTGNTTRNTQFAGYFSGHFLG